ncbi:tyrosine-type recombinase/integrase [Marinobacterium sediminicola]|uniref:Integrase n=1 Tax=Marinobacterium sediminicola TaxID=518898 RepID=A0ABY1S308_9GAMM|nr:integrase arm-type DNA-binding domain-containing protein [Marinobacterium sediminicola]ULG69300.1 tyrosine-type recombinase/integrase [Marinobacterium sediminicola]SMR77651.1 Integrase [Marinobacterium sediminicola]
MALSNTALAKAKPQEKRYKLTDRDGLYVLVQPSGTKTFKYDYRILGKRGTFTIGTYPEISLAEAREKLVEARRLVSEGINPTTIKHKQIQKAATTEKRFSDYAKEWIAKQNYRPSTLKDLKLRLEKNIYPALDKRPVETFSTRDLLNIMQPVTEREARETAKRMAGIIRRVYNDLLLLGIVDNNPAQGLAELLPKVNHRTKSNFGHLTDTEELKILLQQIHASTARRDRLVDIALKLMPLLFLRPGNIRFMKWDYIDFNKALITIPAIEMKAGKELKIPLARQALELLQEAYTLRRSDDYVFVTPHGKGKPISENTTTQAIRKMINPKTGKPFGTGFMTSHGFRHTASTFLNEMGYSPDAIELQLAHESRDRVRATYNKAQLLDERARMMQDWADFLDNLRNA